MCFKQVKYWDLWMGMNLIFSALVTPYQVAFLTSAVDGEVLLNIKCWVY